MLPSIDVPAHLREYIVEQNYAEYTAEDQAVWRFVLLQTHAQLLRTAHPAYVQGFVDTGISVDRIPRIDEMSERMSRFGWRAVCVDGFIPPRAFQAFQARGVLPIAADIRTARHLKYTPAPDIIHEAAGHAPFLAHPDYARYLRKIGAVAERAFASRTDRDLYEAVYTLSEVKEDPVSTPEQIVLAERAVARANADQGAPSESTKMARLFWWTAEYGLVGTQDDFRLYGAGLLSSLVEGRFCHDPAIRKRPLDAGCTEVGYDITRAQPQLFVARDFSHLEEVLETVACGLAHRMGGQPALERAMQSGEVATVTFDSGVQIGGVVAALSESAASDEIDFLSLSGPCAIARNGRVLDEMPRTTGAAVPLGVLADGRSLAALVSAEIDARTDPDGVLSLRLRSGLSLQGRIVDRLVTDGRVEVVVLDQGTIARDDRILFRGDRPTPFVLAHHVITAAAGAPEGFFPPTLFSTKKVPRPRAWNAAQRALIDLHLRATEAWSRKAGAEIAHTLDQIAGKLDADHPDEWLLRWSLLERLVRLGERDQPVRRLVDDLERLEIRYHHAEPIATGLSYVRALMEAS